MTRTDDLMATMQRHLQGTAFVLARTPKGFDIDLDLANPQWWGVLAETRLSETSSFQIHTSEIDSKYTIVEIPRYIGWGGDDAPHFLPSGSGAPRKSGSDQIDRRVSAEPIRRLVRHEADGFGFRESIDRKKILPMLAAAAGGIALVVIAIVVIVNVTQG